MKTLNPLPLLVGAGVLWLLGADPVGLVLGVLFALAAWDFLHLDQH